MELRSVWERIQKSASSANILGFLLLLAFVVYANGLRNDFVYDDHSQIEQNSYLQSFHFVRQILTTNMFSFQGAEGQSNYYRPVVMLGYLLANKAFAGEPFGFHLVNLLLNCAVVFLVFAVTREIFRDQTIALVSGALFALHPVHSEAVDWVAAVNELELAAFLLLSFLLYLRLRESGGGRRGWLYVAMVGSYGLALFSKEQAILFPILVTAYEHFWSRQAGSTRFGEKVRHYTGFWVAAGVYLAIRVRFLGAIAPVPPLRPVTTKEVVFTAFALFGQYMRKLVWPFPLIAYYPTHKSASWHEPRVLLGIGVALALIVLLIVLWRKRRIYAFALLWILVLISPVLNVRVLPASYMGERYLYLPSVGFCWLLSGPMLAIWTKWAKPSAYRRAVLGAAAALLAVVCSVAIWGRTGVWHDDKTFLSTMLRDQPGAYYLRTNYAGWEWAEGDKTAALRDWKQAIKERPDNFLAYSEMGRAMATEGKFEEALADLSKSIEIKPTHTAAYMYRGQVYLAMNKRAQAEADLKKATELAPLNTSAQNILGNLYLSEGRVGEARERFEASLESRDTVGAWSGLAECMVRGRDAGDAERACRRAQQLYERDPRGHACMGMVYLSRGQLAEAEMEYRIVLALNPTDPAARQALAQIESQRTGEKR